MKHTMEDLLRIMAELRGEPGCPWDKAQTHETLRPYAIEEAYEVVDAINRHSSEDLTEELGDLLLQVVFHARLGEERGEFDFSDVVAGVCQKMIRRHPHIFGETLVRDQADVLKNWEEIKQGEKHQQTLAQSMKSLPKTLPALMEAFKVQEKASRVGFDWDDVKYPMDKVADELRELKEVYNGENRDKIKEELGDLIFSCVNVARLLEIEPELCLREATQKFIRRFEKVESETTKAEKNMQDMTLDELDKLWDEAKKMEKSSKTPLN